jgi:hypothetical protein
MFSGFSLTKISAFWKDTLSDMQLQIHNCSYRYIKFPMEKLRGR